MTIETILRQKGTDVATIEPEASVTRAADWLRVKNIGALVVTRGKTVLGIISEREIVHALSHYGETVASMPVKEIMRYGVITVSPDESVSRVMAPYDAPSRAPHARAARRQARRYHQHR
jgi:CBS domain-containing protein